MDVSAKDHPSGDHDEEKNDDLDKAKDVHDFDTETRSKGMYARNDDNHCNCDPPFPPFGDFVVRRNQNILCEDNTAGCCSFRSVSILFPEHRARYSSSRHIILPSE